MEKYDFLIVGAGPSGCVMAERLASIRKKILMIDKRDHIGGNCYDYYDDFGVLVHKYGPHYFRAKDKVVIDYLSNFTEWIEQRYKVAVCIKGKVYSFPINKKTIEQFFNVKLKDEEEVKRFLEERRQKEIIEPKNAEEQVLSLVGKEIYEGFFKGYTKKQWGIEPKFLDKEVTARIPIRYNENDDYIIEGFQAMPKEGYTKMFEKMISNKNIKLILSKTYENNLSKIAKKIIWTGPIDEYFNYKFGNLPYRSLKFIFASFRKEYVQEIGQINYPEEDIPYTRIVEIKHVTKQSCPNTTISIEFPEERGEPYYPMPTKEAKDLYKKYEELAKKEKNVYFLGRLAKYKYLNMDQCIEEALNLFEEIKNETL
ncbi:MAG: UDP-galactopyranose mutase [Candidatus Pacearchaeota archaeon]